MPRTHRHGIVPGSLAALKARGACLLACPPRPAAEPSTGPQFHLFQNVSLGIRPMRSPLMAPGPREGNWSLSRPRADGCSRWQPLGEK